VSPLTRAWRVVQQVHWLVSGLLILDYMGSKCDKKEILPCPSLEKIKQAPQLQKKCPKEAHLVSDVTENWILTICLAG
jgi:hypothetical protein